MITGTSLSKTYGDRTALDEISLSVQKGEIVGIIGPSGSGKSTLLRLLDLIETPTTGTIALDGVPVPTGRHGRLQVIRQMGMVFQRPAVFSGTVSENISAGLRFRGEEKEVIDKEVKRMLGLIRLEGYGDRIASTLSGGELQRVAIARAAVTRPVVLFMDEPTANLDPHSTAVIEDMIHHLATEEETTILLATHDMVQGQRLCDRIGVMIDGRLVQTGTPDEIFSSPATPAVATFTGIDNLLNGYIEAVTDGIADFVVAGHHLQAIIVSDRYRGPAILSIRPEEVTLTFDQGSDGSARNQMSGTISRILPLGPLVRVTVDCDAVQVTALITRASNEEMHLTVGRVVTARFKASAAHIILEL
ncbi:ABC transporter ATP-binding protein [Methanosphaerula palustris]|uniref:Molybdate/tungstate import ATP-binding protein WtpC n=1 Tax=Methanosphaerula palustris (strain ATCC BAA-1556 / DSM 19958 / E1-9c) TaxID=521011 RepID=B8GE88_METPE|nr:ABC transporter ATP-binding protein [Methanosphaerula palustris]ACL17589.1 ABC transporter related [Methanosphaerula palustris E1-9c]